jgi:hypothetical protein
MITEQAGFRQGRDRLSVENRTSLPGLPEPGR